MRKVRILKDLRCIDKADNLTIGKVVETINPPEDKITKTTEVWVMGIENTPIKLIDEEFEFLLDGSKTED